MGGFVFAKSKGLNCGASFYVCLPYCPQSATITQAVHFKYDKQLEDSILNAKSDVNSNSKGQCDSDPHKNVLFAEDNLLSQKVVKMMLEKLGFNVTVASDGKEAEDLYRSKSNWDFVLLDYEMPFQNGAEIAKKIKRNEKRLPVIILTAHSTEKDKERIKFPSCRIEAPLKISWRF